MVNFLLREKGDKYKAIGFMFIVIGFLGISLPFIQFKFFSDAAFLDDAVAMQIETASGSADFPLSDERRTFDYPNHPDIPNRLTLESADVNMPVFLSEDSSTLLKGGWMVPISTPDQGGNTVIFGHRVRYLPPITNTFFHLDRAKVGDSVRFVWNGKEYNYRITSVRVVDPSDLSVIKQTDTPRLTLITCAPLFSTKYRLVVVGEPI